MKRNNTVKSVVKAMKIFEVLVQNRRPLSLSKLSKKVGINISTVHRLLNTLLDIGYVKQDEEGKYGLGMRSFKLADIISDEFELKKLVHPYLEEIVSSCNETSNLVVLEDYQVVYLDQVESNNMVRMFASEGSKGAAYCTGAGKVLLAFLKEEKLKNYLQKVELKPFTENTFTKVDKFKKELEKIKKQGYALDLEEKEKGVRCAAAPFFGDGNNLLGAISVSGPSSRITRKYLKQNLVPLVKSKAEEITEGFQGH